MNNSDSIHSSNSKNVTDNHKRQEYVKDRRIYTVKVSTSQGSAIYKAWEHSDDDMNHHFRVADEAGIRFFSFTDVRGKFFRNVDVKAGWRYKMTLRWNPQKISAQGKQGDWQDIRQWYNEKKNKKLRQNNINYREEKRDPDHSQSVKKNNDDGNTEDEHFKVVVKAPLIDETCSFDENDKTTVIMDLEKEKAALLDMLSR